MTELHQLGLLAQLEHLDEQPRQSLQVPLAELTNGPEIRRVERHNTHEINALAAGLGDPPRGVDAAAIRIEQKRRHHRRIKWRLAFLAEITGRDLDQVQLLGHKAHHEASEMVFAHKVLRARRQQLRFVDLPGAKYLAHARARI